MMRKPQLQVLELALGATPVETAVLDGGNARRIIPAIFQPAQRIDESTGHRFRSEYADDAAHGSFLASKPGLLPTTAKRPLRLLASPVPVQTPIGQIPQ
jgi:hypothetical protein